MGRQLPTRSKSYWIGAPLKNGTTNQVTVQLFLISFLLVGVLVMTFSYHKAFNAVKAFEIGHDVKIALSIKLGYRIYVSVFTHWRILW